MVSKDIDAEHENTNPDGTVPLPFPAGCPACGVGDYVRLVTIGGLRPIRLCVACDVLWAVPRRRPDRETTAEAVEREQADRDPEIPAP